MTIQKKLSGSGFAPLQVTNVIGDSDPNVTSIGSSAATAYLLGAANTRVTTAAASTGVILPPGTTGAPNFTSQWDEYTVANSGANTLTVYPPTGGTIDGSASATIAAGSLKYFTCVSGDGLTWYSK
jgi:hypothetical protein